MQRYYVYFLSVWVCELCRKHTDVYCACAKLGSQKGGEGKLCCVHSTVYSFSVKFIPASLSKI